MGPIRRARSVPKNLGSDSHEMTDSNARNEHLHSEDTLDRNNIRRLVMANPEFAKYMNAIRLVRIIQLILGPILITINAVLLVRYMSLQGACLAGSDDGDCEIYRKAVGAFKYCVVPGVIGIIQAVYCLAATFKDPLPLHTIVGADNAAAGFYMGGGCTLAAILNGWSCEAGDGAASRSCSLFYASIALFFLGVVLSYAMVPTWCYIRTQAKRSQ